MRTARTIEGVDGSLGFLRGFSRYQWLVFFVAWAGWSIDATDFGLFSLVLRPALTELYKRAGYMIALTYAPSWEEKFGRDAGTLRRVGQDEFRKTARKINQRAEAIGTDADYHEQWGSGR